MFKSKKIITMLFAVAMIASIIANVSASNSDTYLTNFRVSKYQSYTPTRTKDNASSIYAKITSTTGNARTAKVDAWGYEGGETFLQLCNYGGNERLIPFYKATMIRNTVKENGYRYAALGFAINGVGPDYYINGAWSPDSVPQSGSITI